MRKLLLFTLAVGFSFASMANETDEMNVSQAKLHIETTIEQLSKDANPETKKYLKEIADATKVILDNTKTPVYAIGFMAGVDAGVQFKVFKLGEKNVLVGPGGQAIWGPIFTRVKDKSGKKSIQVNSASLAGVNLTVKRSKDVVDVGFQGQMGVVLIFAHKNKDGTPRTKRPLDLAGWYYGFAGEGAIPVFLLNRIRLNVGIYSLVDGEEFTSEAGKNPFSLLSAATQSSLDSWKKENMRDATSETFKNIKALGRDSLSSAGATIKSFMDNVVIGDATMIVINGQVGSKDVPLELQAEALKLKLAL